MYMYAYVRQTSVELFEVTYMYMYNYIHVSLLQQQRGAASQLRNERQELQTMLCRQQSEVTKLQNQSSKDRVSKSRLK